MVIIQVLNLQNEHTAQGENISLKWDTQLRSRTGKREHYIQMHIYIYMYIHAHIYTTDPWTSPTEEG